MHINIYKAAMSSTTINNKTIYEETIKYFRIIYNIVSKGVLKNPVFFECTVKCAPQKTFILIYNI